MKFGKKALACVLTSAAVLACGIASAGACTGVYVGKEVSASGNAMFGRSEDIGSEYNKIFFVHEAGDHKAGETYVDGYGFSYTYKTDSLRYTAVKDDPKAEDFGSFAREGLTSYEEAGTNEKGVALTATVTIHSSEKIVGETGVDQNVDTGIDEISYATVLLGQATTAREGVELLAEIVARDGAADNHCIMIGDQNEVWYMEILSGHQYAAYKLPDDVVLVNPNVNMLREIDVNDTENYLVSENLIAVAQQAGTFVGDAENGVIDVQQSYGNVADGNGFDDNCRYRVAMGQNFLNASMNTSPDADEFVLTFTPDRKISVEDLTEFFAQHGEGTDYDSYQNDIRGISTPRQAESHIFELIEDVPADLSVVEWLAMAQPDYSVFVPYYPCLLNDTLAAYQVEGTAYTDGSAYWAFQRTAALGDADHEGAGETISAAYDALQKQFITEFAAQQKSIASQYAADPAAARETATTLGMTMAQAAIDKANELYTQLTAAPAEDARFDDVSDTDWFADAVAYVVENNLFQGMTDTTFQPRTAMNRAMLVTVLHRYAGTPKAESAAAFSDVAAGAYYTDAVAWAAENEIVTGYEDGTFRPTTQVSREQLVSILYRYAQKNGIDVSVGEDTNILSYDDVAELHEYAIPAMQWACGASVVSGRTASTIAPRASSTRAEVAAIMMRFAALAQA